DQSNNEIQTWEIPQALANLSTIQPLDILIFDASLEQMTEVAHEVRNSAKVMVGSEESPPGEGYPYHLWINALKSSGKNRCDLGQSIVDTFVGFYPTADNITQSVLDLTTMDTLASSLDAFAITLQQHTSDQATVIQNARNNVQHFATEYADNKD